LLELRVGVLFRGCVIGSGTREGGQPLVFTEANIAQYDF
jgi:hypothetical protein